MFSLGNVVFFLVMFLAAAIISFCGGFFIARKYCVKEKQVFVSAKEKLEEPIEEEPQQSFFDKIIEYIEDGVFRKKKEEEVKKVQTIDGLYKPDNELY